MMKQTEKEIILEKYVNLKEEQIFVKSINKEK